GIKRLDPRAKAIECLLKVKALQINERHAHVSLVRPMLERKRELLKLFEQFGVRHKWLKCLSSMLIIFDLRREKATGYDLSLCRFISNAPWGEMSRRKCHSSPFSLSTTAKIHAGCLRN